MSAASVLRRATGSFFAVLLIFPPCVHTAGAGNFMGLGELPGGNIFVPADLSADGSVVVGVSGDQEAVRWSVETGFVRMGDLLGGDFRSGANGVSADGSVIVGWGHTDVVGPQAFRWTEATGMVGLDAGLVRSFGTGISADGTVIIGSWDFLSCDDDCGRAFRWTAESGMVHHLYSGIDIDDGPVARTVSADGTVITGWAEFDSVLMEDGYWVFRWTEATGMIPLFKGLSFDRVDVAAASNDGSVIVGWRTGSNPWGREAYRWSEETGAVRLGDFLPSGMFGDAIIGTTYEGTPVIWDVVHGIRNLSQAFVKDFGLDLTGWTLDWSFGSPLISDDGSVIVGDGINPSGNREAWMAVIPEPSPGDFNASRVLDARDIDLLSAELGQATPSDWFDVNDDTLVNFADHKFWIRELKNTWYGDADLNGEFNSDDFVQVFQVGKYEATESAGWSEGDWNADGLFTSDDFITAFQDGGYEQGPRTDLAAVPEPSGWLLLLFGLVGVIRRKTTAQNRI